jgi:hypothetical protein
MSRYAYVRPEGKVDRRAIDREWVRARTSSPEADTVVVDLSGARYLENAALMYLLALSAASTDATNLKIELPEAGSSLLEFMRSWRFPEALAHVETTRGAKVLTERSQSILAQVANTPARYARAILDPDGGLESLMSERFFALTPLRLELGGVYVARLERERWLRDHVVKVLDRGLKGARTPGTSPGREFATQVVYEAVLNCSRHPAAQSAFVCSQIDTDTEELVLNIWDDGQPIYETLARARSERTLYSPSFGIVEEVIKCTVTDEVQRSTWNFQASSTDSRLDESNVSEVELMLGAFLLGVTSAAESVADSNTPYADPVQQFRGAGLYLLRRTALVELKGVVEYVTGSYHLSMETDKVNIKNYKATVRRNSSNSPVAKGNVLTIRIPLRHNADTHG